MVLTISPSTLVFVLALITTVAWARPGSEDIDERDTAHQVHRTRRSRGIKDFNPEDDSEFWINGAQNLLSTKLGRKPITGQAKNVIMFLGDGFSIPTLAAARVYLGQSLGATGEETVLSFEEFPNTGLSKTYCVDSQVADSSCSATAYLGGVKGNIGTAGVTGRVKVDDCAAMRNVSNQVPSILKWSQDAGKSTGVVTTTRITHASPSGTYAYIANRDWENDAEIKNSGQDPDICDDIAEQLVNKLPGKNINVILGGGRKEFRPRDFTDEDGTPGSRTDDVDLIEVWKADKVGRNASFRYLWNRDQIMSVDPTDSDYVLGLFNRDHLEYHLLANRRKEPTLEEMTTFAVQALKKNPNGFFLFVEGGRIDMGLHDNKAHLALDEAVEFANAVQAAVDLTDEEDTLIVVTADHAHTLSISGYPVRGNNIFGISGTSSVDNLPYATLSFANGPGYKQPEEDGTRYDISRDNTMDANYEFPATSPLYSETHGGDDVAVFARGPWSHLYAGAFEQNFIPHVMAYASCVGNGRTSCNDNRK
ncbi:membrane-bound alkaline phosphatase-like [Zootermopsis nevadensis]|uniref:Alkaline phosphatase n=1 Tax=Zootermopsis nevadensis TaxID=136037 RepID=A0A067QT98_ZOONE|nr:membrane-bound alkaline phosphatase-like [Zootermopsis nevadensis]KDR12135.1 Membrane-bound alkaline phosphatase [Zootermopsis nevadensis]